MFKQNPDVDMDMMRFRLGGGTRYFTTGLFAASLTTANPATNWLAAIPFFTPVNMKIDRIACEVTTAVIGYYARMGIYEDDGKVYPGKLILDAGQVDIGTIGVKEIVIDKTLRGGKLYWLVGICNINTAYFRTPSVTTFHATIFGHGSLLGTPYERWYQKSGVAFGPLPDPFPSGAVLQSTNWEIGIFIRKA